jgi:hypothetical protein
MDVREVAKSIRPMLEGYLHRRFPGKINKEVLFGQMVQEIQRAQLPNPLIHAQGLVNELNEINSYAGLFHHDTNTVSNVVETELRIFIERALSLVHKGIA